MEEKCSVNYSTYPNVNCSCPNDRYVCEVEFINHVTGISVKHRYFGYDKKRAIITARGQATKFRNRILRIYG